MRNFTDHNSQDAHTRHDYQANRLRENHATVTQWVLFLDIASQIESEIFRLFSVENFGEISSHGLAWLRKNLLASF